MILVCRRHLDCSLTQGWMGHENQDSDSASNDYTKHYVIQCPFLKEKSSATISTTRRSISPRIICFRRRKNKNKCHDKYAINRTRVTAYGVNCFTNISSSSYSAISKATKYLHQECPCYRCVRHIIFYGIDCSDLIFHNAVLVTQAYFDAPSITLKSRFAAFIKLYN